MGEAVDVHLESQSTLENEYEYQQFQRNVFRSLSEGTLSSVILLWSGIKRTKRRRLAATVVHYPLFDNPENANKRTVP